jgi:hypothetical protein
MAATTSLHSFFRALTRRSRRMASHPEGVPKAGLNLPRRIDDPASAARVARDLLRSRREDVTLVLYMDDRHRFVGHAVVAVGWVQAARLSDHPVLLYAQACRATGSILVRYRRYGALSATEAEQASFRAIRGSVRPSRARCGGPPGSGCHGRLPLGLRWAVTMGCRAGGAAARLGERSLLAVTPLPYHQMRAGVPPARSATRRGRHG